MSDGNELPHRAFVAPRIPFDLRCVTLAAAGYLVLMLVDMGLGHLFDVGSPIGQIVDRLATEIGRVAFLGDGFRTAMAAIWGIEEYALNWWQAILVSVVFLLVWAIFGGALITLTGDSQRFTSLPPPTIS